ncbi:MAG: integrase [Oscillospiraceae bacterium]|nr:integrase [Oscillospiraceae bacterium]
MDEHTELGNTEFDFNGYEVVRAEFFAHIHEPSITFCDSKVYVNTACLKKLPDALYIQFLVNPSEKRIVIKPCPEDTKDSFLWCLASGNKRKPRKISCNIFFDMISEIMNWNRSYRYKILGNIIFGKKGSIILFDLRDAETYKRIAQKDKGSEGTAVSYFPEEWKNRFGLPVEEHKKLAHINIFDDYTVFSIDRQPSYTERKDNSDEGKKPYRSDRF